MDPPKLNANTRADIVRQLQELAPNYLPARLSGAATRWLVGDPGRALVEIFARYMEIIIERLNRVPEKNLLAFLDMVGVNLLPPIPARAPVQFLLAKGTKVESVVPKGTQLGTAGANPLVFETERTLTTTHAQLVQAVTYVPRQDRLTIHPTAMFQSRASFKPFAGTELIDHRLYVGHNTALKLSKRTKLIVKCRFLDVQPKHVTLLTSLSWWHHGKEAPVRIEQLGMATPVPQPVEGQSVPITVTWELAISSPIEPRTVQSMMTCWIWAKTEQPVTADLEPFPKVESVTFTSSPSETVKPDALCFNNVVLDLKKGVVLPFGERPKISDAFYIGSDEIFSKTGATAHLTFNINPQGVSPNSLALRWEYWNGSGWTSLTGVDETKKLSVAEETVSFAVPNGLVPTKLNGVESHWIRVRIQSGDYGGEGKLMTSSGGTPSPNTPLTDLRYSPPNFKPPGVTAITLSYQYPDSQAGSIVAENSFHAENVTQPFVPFQTATSEDPALYLAFDRRFANKPVSLFVAVVDREELPREPIVTWEYWNGGWKNLGTRDETKHLTESGLVEFVGPSDQKEGTRFGIPQSLFWIRARLLRGEPSQFAIRAISPNVVWVRHSVTVQNEVLGSSTGKPHQSFLLSRTPVLMGQRILVREPDMVSSDSQKIASMELEQGMGRTGGTRGIEAWMEWREVPYFHLSRPEDRHYIIDRVSGRIQFGDGVQGRIPPADRDSVLVKEYQIGGGEKGNVSAGTITILKRAVPHIDRVVNLMEASGGSDQETIKRVMDRGPLVLKHRDRAITFEDYEWLAKESSVQVARALCMGARDAATAGKVNLLIMPYGDEPQPTPSFGLLRQVKTYLDQRRPPALSLTLVAPRYVQVSVTVEIVPVLFEEADMVRQRVIARLIKFFHPLSGGPDETGWEFGRDAHVSEVAAVIEAVEGVDHVKTISLAGVLDDEDRTQGGGRRVVVNKGRGELVATGEHRLTMVGA